MGPAKANERRRWVSLIAPPALFVFAFGVRCLPIQNILLDGRTIFFGSDAYYHLRRIAYSIVHFPNSLNFDPYINFPHGGEPIWTPLFDWTIAALLRPFWGMLGVAELEKIAIFVPPLLGASTVVVLYFVVRRHFGTSTAVLAGALLSVLSGHFWYSQVGFVDHHAAVALVATATLGAAMAMMTGVSDGNSGMRPTRASTLATGLGIGLSLLLWPGALLHVALIEAALLLFVLTRSDRAVAVGFASSIAWAHIVALLLIWPFGIESQWTAWGRFSPVVLSRFQPWAMATSAFIGAGCALAWSFEPIGSSRPRRVQSAVAIGACFLLSSHWVYPELFPGLADAWEWFAKTDAFQAHVGESAPLFEQGGAFTLDVAFTRLSAFSIFVPIALCVGVASAIRKKNRANLLLFYCWAFGLSTVTIFQRRFFNSASVAVALLFAVSLVCLHQFVSSRVPSKARWVATAGVASLALFLMLPVIYSYGWDAANLVNHLRGEPTLISPRTHKNIATVEMANWLQANTPAPSNWMNPREKPAYGILAPWTIGHILEYEARRPTVTDNFGDDIGRENFLLARRYYQSDELAAAELLERLSVRYVVAQRAPEFLGEDPVPGSMFFSLFRHDGALAPSRASGSGNAPTAALARHRLLFETRASPGAESPDEPYYKVFEFVAGAEVTGSSSPGARIRVMLPVETNRGRRFVYAAETIADSTGRYAIRLPYANRGGPSSVRVEAAYTFECRGDRHSVRIDESDVVRGGRVAGPSICMQESASSSNAEFDSRI